MFHEGGYKMTRDYIGEHHLNVDGRAIWYRLVNANDYFEAKGYSESQIDEFFENKIGTIVNQIMALKQSCVLLRHTSHSCGSLSDDLYRLKNQLINELREKHSFDFDDEFVEEYGH